MKTKIGYEKYLTQIQNTNTRISFTKLRLSNHHLMIETGRHQHIEKTKRFCPFCPTKIEDELHSILDCHVFKTPREDLFNDLREIYNFSHLALYVTCMHWICDCV